tara:strand:- start:4950 stop:8177 length:3228 start_codon:yes stop_codon:yes gene_type:complete
MKIKWNLALIFLVIIKASVNGAELKIGLASETDQVVVEAKKLDQARIGSLMFSDDLNNWFPTASTDQAALNYNEHPISGRRYFQIQETTPPRLTSSLNWKTKITLPEDKFLIEFKAQEGIWIPPGNNKTKETQWVKFTVLMDDLTTVYFQNGNSMKFHYEFGTKFVPEFDGMSHMEFDGASLFHAGRRAIIGAVLFSEKHSEYAIQFVGQDKLPAPMVSFLWQLVDGVIDKPETLRGLYMPTYEQSGVSSEIAEALGQIDVPLVSALRWETGSDVVYSMGWAMGRLVFVEGSKISAAFRLGKLKSDDILLTDYVPAEIPRVAGIIALHPSTPNSHVAILAKNFGVPFYYEGDEATRLTLTSLEGREVMLSTKAGGGINQSQDDSAKLIGLEADLPDTFRNEINKLKTPPDLKFEAKKTSGVYTKEIKSVKPTDTAYVGGKAAKFYLLRKHIPNNSPDPAIAITFDLWDEFIGHRLGNGKTIREEIDDRLFKAQESGLQAEMEDALKSVRKLIRDGEFLESQRQAILAALSPFEKDRKIRFRSSTNIEDSRYFTGAGLYDSFSGCLLDELDNDTSGPCACDGNKEKERGVFRAIKRVYASFYNDNAYLERKRFGVNESEVGMAILVHHSFPDEIELANGVAVSVFRKYSGLSFGMETSLSTQIGATSVTNPDTTAVPEIVSVSGYRSSNGATTSRRVNFFSRSSLLQVGQDHVMAWKQDYESLQQLLEKVASGYTRYATDSKNYTLDFEYKKITPNKLIVKQVREVPIQTQLESPTPVLAGGQAMLRLFQGEHGGSVFARHRLKSVWDIQALSRVLNAAGKDSSVVDTASWTRVVDGEALIIQNGLDNWDGHRFSTKTENNVTYLIDQWEETRGGEIVKYKLSAGIPRWMPDRNSPIIFADELQWKLEANYKKFRTDHQQQAFGGSGLTKKKVRTDQIELRRFDPSAVVTSDDLLQQRLVKSKGGKKIQIEFYWPPHPTGPTAGYTAPLQAWKETVITGLTEEPIILKGWYSQTYAPGHHNFWEEFIFEPSKEEGLSEIQRNELEEADVKLIYIFNDRGRSASANIIGFDDEARAF